jgi:hypothetical protein
MNMEAADGVKVKVLLPLVRLRSLSCCFVFGLYTSSSGFADVCVCICICLLQPPQAHDVTATFVEIVGTVVDATTMKLLTCINLGSQLGGGPYLSTSRYQY